MQNLIIVLLWSHYRTLLQVEDEKETLEQTLKVRTLQRNERKKQRTWFDEQTRIYKNAVIAEFLRFLLEDNYTETQLETSIINLPLTKKSKKLWIFFQSMV